MPFEPAPKITTNPWTERFPREAKALADLSDYVRTIPNKLWDYTAIRTNAKDHPCKTIGCALGHAPFIPSCCALGIRTDMWGTVGYQDEGMFIEQPEDKFRLPEEVAVHIFYGGQGLTRFGTSYGVGMERVTQKMVADRIDHFLATGEINVVAQPPLTLANIRCEAF